MKKIVLSIFVAVISLASVNSYASTAMSTVSAKNTVVQAVSNDINSEQGFHFKDTNLFPDPRVNNK